MLKLLIFYGGVFILITTTMIVWLVWPPKLLIVAVADEAAGAIRCKLRLKRSRRPTTLKEISLPRDLAESLGVTPPPGFGEKKVKPSSKRHAAYLEKLNRETVFWCGKVVISRGEEIVLSIPAANPKGGGTMYFDHEIRALVGYLSTREDVQIQNSVPTETAPENIRYHERPF